MLQTFYRYRNATRSYRDKADHLVAEKVHNYASYEVRSTNRCKEKIISNKSLSKYDFSTRLSEAFKLPLSIAKNERVDSVTNQAKNRKVNKESVAKTKSEKWSKTKGQTHNLHNKSNK